MAETPQLRGVDPGLRSRVMAWLAEDPDPVTRAPTDGLRYFLTGGARVVVRPSGTEPKLKCYLEVIEEIDGDDVAPARAKAADVLDGIKDDLRMALGLTSVMEGVA